MTDLYQPPRHITFLEELPFLAWLDDAACVGEDPELWFVEYGRNDEARAICLRCPLFFACTMWGLEHPEHGMWGGLGEHARTRIRRQREKAAA